MSDNSEFKQIGAKIIKGTIKAKTRKITKAAYVVLRIPVDINKKSGKCKYLRFEFPVSHLHKYQIRDYFLKKFCTGKFPAKVSIKYKPYKLELMQELQACHGLDVQELMLEALTKECKSEIDRDICKCGHMKNAHSEKTSGCFFSYNCDCKTYSPRD